MNRIITFFWLIFGKTYVAEKCGHKTKLHGCVSAFGEDVFCKITPAGGKVEYCIECAGKMTIRCAWCGKPIFIDDPITLYSPIKESVTPDYAVAYGKEPLQLVGCLRRNCAETGADRAGFWVVPGRVLRAISPLERVFSARNCVEDKVVVIRDLRDMAEVPLEASSNFTKKGGG